MFSRTSEALLLLALCTCFFASGCFDKTSQGGFFVTTEDCGFDEFGVVFCVPHPFVPVNGRWVRDLASGASGGTRLFPPSGSGFVSTDSTGRLFVEDGRVEAVWDAGVQWNPPCNGQTSAVASWTVVKEDPVIPWACGPAGIVFPPPHHR